MCHKHQLIDNWKAGEGRLREERATRAFGDKQVASRNGVVVTIVPSTRPGGSDDEPVFIDGAALLDAVDKFIGQYVVYPSDEARHSVTLWVAHTHLMELWDSTPRLHFYSAEPGSGKTRALEVIEHLVHRGFIALNMTPAALIRRLGDKPEKRPTLLVDEVDTIFGPKAKEHEDIRGIINAGHRKSGKSSRCVPQGNQWVVEDFPAYGAVGLAGLFDLPDTIRNRAIVISLKKRNKATEQIKPWRVREDESKAKVLGAFLARWAASVKQALRTEQGYEFVWPAMPDGIEDRVADCWEALFACAAFAGGRWPQICDNAALAALADAREQGESQGVLLLADLRGVFVKRMDTNVADNDPDEIARQALKTPTLIAELKKLDEAPWGSFRRDGSSITAKDLANLLKPYGIKSDNIWWSKGTNSKGYYRKSFEDAWARYVAESDEKE